jgi:hypothetical protein
MPRNTGSRGQGNRYERADLSCELRLDVREKIGVDFLGVRRRHAVAIAGIDLSVPCLRSLTDCAPVAKNGAI